MFNLIIQSLQGNEFRIDGSYYYFYSKIDCERQCTFCDYDQDQYGQDIWKGNELFCSDTPGLTDDETFLVAVLVPFAIIILITVLAISLTTCKRKQMLKQQHTQVVKQTTYVTQQQPQYTTTQSYQPQYQQQTIQPVIQPPQQVPVYQPQYQQQTMQQYPLPVQQNIQIQNLQPTVDQYPIL